MYDLIKTKKFTFFQLKLVIKISDTGIGMTKSQIDKLFQDYQSNTDHQYNPHGTGLGLCICKQLL